MATKGAFQTVARTAFASSSRTTLRLAPRTASPAIRRAYSSSPVVRAPQAQAETNIPRSESNQPTLKQCPKCSRTVLPIVSPCPYCSTLLPIPEDVSHHALLGLSAATKSDPKAELSELPCSGFELDVKDLRNRMLQRQRDFHPDRFQGQGDQLELAKAISGRINKAYGILSDDLKRAQYILKQLDMPTLETDNMSDPEMLMAILEAREVLEEAQSEEEVETLREENAERIQASTAALREALSKIPPALEEAKQHTVELRYWRGLEDAAREWKPSVEGQQREGKQATCLVD